MDITVATEVIIITLRVSRIVSRLLVEVYCTGSI